MSLHSVINPYPSILGQNGSGLNGGRVYIGLPNQDPETNPASVYWDEAGADPAAQPLSTIGGYIARAGSPAQVFAPSEYSIRVRDRFGVQVFYEPNARGPLGEFIDGLLSSVGAGSVGFSHSQSYTPGTVGFHLSKFVTITDAPFNGKGDDSTNNDAAFAAAIAYIQSIGGGDLYIPHGVFRVTNINVLLSGNYAVNIIGQGEFSVIKTTSATLDVITLGAWWSVVRGIRIVSSITRTAGKYIDMAGNWQTVEKCQFEGDFIGVYAEGVGSKIRDNQFYTGALNARRIWLAGGDTSMQITGNVMAYQISPQVQAGIFLDDNIAAEIANNSIVGQGRPISVAPGNGQSVTDLYVLNNFLDTSINGAAVEPSGSGIVARSVFEGNRSSNHSVAGYVIDSTACTTGGIDGIDILRTRSFNNIDAGVSIKGTKTKNVRVLGGAIRGKASGAAATGVSVGANVTDFVIKGVSFRDGDGYLGNLNGIFLDSGTDNYEISDNDLRNQVSAPILNGVAYTATKRTFGNQGFITASSGADSVASAATSKVVNHGCTVAPRAQDITIEQTVAPGVIGNVLYLDTTSITSTQFTVRCGVAAAGTLNFTWKVEGGDK